MLLSNPLILILRKNIKQKEKMYKTNIVKILKNLSKTELRELGKFVQSPYFNSRAEVVQLYDALTQSLDAPPSVYEKEKLFAQIAPTSRTYDDAQMRQWIHQLLKVIKAYFVQKEIEDNKAEHQLLLAKAFRKRGMDEMFEKEIENSLISNTEQPFRHADFHLQNYQIEVERIEHLTLLKRTGELAYDSLLSSLTTFFISEMLRLGSVTNAYKISSKRDLTLPLLDEVINFLENNDFLIQNREGKESIILAIYYNMFKALNTYDRDNFNAVKKLLENNWQFLPKVEALQIYGAAFNFCTKKINNGENEYLEHYFDLNESGLKNGSLLENGIISKFIFKNAISAGIKLQKFTWVRQFLDDYKPLLHIKDRETTYNYNLAVYYLSINEFDKAKVLLHQADFGDLQTNLAGRALLVRIYYETNALDALDSLLDSFQVFIQRQKDIGYYKDNYLNLIKIIRQILKTDLKDLNKKNELKIQVSNTPNIALKDWLLEKLA
jgi:hypothetical protein